MSHGDEQKGKGAGGILPALAVYLSNRARPGRAPLGGRQAPPLSPPSPPREWAGLGEAGDRRARLLQERRMRRVPRAGLALALEVAVRALLFGLFL